jgi:hypothetical protein
MPTPVYIICAESGSEDSYTGLASLFNIIDRLKIGPPGPEIGGLLMTGWPTVRIVAVWKAAEESDFEGEFKSEIRLILPTRDIASQIYEQSFRFLRDKPRHRITAMIGGLQISESGPLVFECRIKRPDASEWLAQQYEIDVVVRSSGPPAP